MPIIDISCIDQEGVERLEKAILDVEFYKDSRLEILDVNKVDENGFVGEHIKVSVKYANPLDLFHLGHFSCFHLMSKASNCEDGCNVEV